MPNIAESTSSSTPLAFARASVSRQLQLQNTARAQKHIRFEQDIRVGGIEDGLSRRVDTFHLKRFDHDQENVEILW